MTTDVIEAATLAAFRQRYATRPFHRFSAQPWPVQGRWTQVCAKVVKGDVKSGQQFRNAYIKGFAGSKEWSQLGREDRDSWGQVFSAAVRAWRAAEAREQEAA